MRMEWRFFFWNLFIVFFLRLKCVLEHEKKISSIISMVAYDICILIENQLENEELNTSSEIITNEWPHDELLTSLSSHLIIMYVFWKIFSFRLNLNKKLISKLPEANAFCYLGAPSLVETLRRNGLINILISLWILFVINLDWILDSFY